MDTHEIYKDESWAYIETLLPNNLERLAHETKAIVRYRNITNASTLIRIILAYAVSDLSLKDTAAWASGANLSKLSGPGLFYRIARAEKWIEGTIRSLIAERSPSSPGKFRYKIVDATVINGPKPSNIDWKLHVVADAEHGGISSFELTDRFEGEGYERHALEPNDVLLGDRAYGTAKGMFAVRKQGAHLLARISPASIRVCNEKREVISLKSFESNVPKLGGLDLSIMVPVPPEPRSKSHKPWNLKKAREWVAARAIAGRTRNGETIWIVTTLPKEELSATEALRTYRFRWQIELLFKRLKSLANIDALPAKQDGVSARTWILARLLAAILVHTLIDSEGAFSPWGYKM